MARPPDGVMGRMLAPVSEWRKGPLPADSWYWGGLVPADLHGSGFYYADFRGDHAILTPGDRKIEAADIAWYNNCIDMPPGPAARAWDDPSIEGVTDLTVLRPGELVISDVNAAAFMSADVDGERKSRGLQPRDYATHPVGYLGALARPFDLPLIPESEWQARLEAQLAAKAQLSNIRDVGMFGQPMPSRDQDGVGYCWCHSGTSGMLIVRAQMNEPYLDLSAFAVGCMIKGFRDQGGWGAEGVEFMGSRGIPTSQYWPQRSMERSNDKPETWANAALHKNVEWMDLDPRNMRAQLVTCLLLGIPVVSDFNWWGHSVLTVDLVSLNPFRTRIWNSWGDNWSANGMGVLEGRKAMPDSGLGVRAVLPAVA